MAAKRRWLAARLRLLQRQAALVERLEFLDHDGEFENELCETAVPAGGGPSAAGLPAFLHTLQPGRVQAVDSEVCLLPDAVVAELPRLVPQLTRLCLAVGSEREYGGWLPDSAAGMLRRLPQLLSLEVHVDGGISNEQLDAIGRLSNLTGLKLACGMLISLPALSQLTRLQRLLQLDLQAFWHGGELAEGEEPPQIPLPARMPALRTCQIYTGGTWVHPKVGGLQ